MTLGWVVVSNVPRMTSVGTLISPKRAGSYSLGTLSSNRESAKVPMPKPNSVLGRDEFLVLMRWRPRATTWIVQDRHRQFIEGPIADATDSTQPPPSALKRRQRGDSLDYCWSCGYPGIVCSCNQSQMTRVTASGCSTCNAWPASGNSTSLTRLGNSSARARPFAGGAARSSSPWSTRIGASALPHQSPRGVDAAD